MTLTTHVFFLFRFKQKWLKNVDKKFKLPDGSYSVSNIQDYFEKFSDKSMCKKIENRTIFTISKGYYLEFLTPETIKLLGRSKNKMTKMKMVKKCLI